MRNPTIWTASELKEFSVSTMHKSGRWVPSRPIPFYGVQVLKNIKLAYCVFIGKYDALDWEDD